MMRFPYPAAIYTEQQERHALLRVALHSLADGLPLFADDWPVPSRSAGVSRSIS